jgi:hypothetical protein
MDEWDGYTDALPPDVMKTFPPTYSVLDDSTGFSIVVNYTLRNGKEATKIREVAASINIDSSKTAKYINMASRDGTLLYGPGYISDYKQNITTFTPAGENPRLYFSSATVTSAVDGDLIAIGDGNSETNRYANFSVASVGESDGVYYVEMAPDDGYLSEMDVTVAAAVNKRSVPLFAATGALYYVPFAHGSDPWIAAPDLVLTNAIYAGYFINAALGGTLTSYISFPSVLRKDYIPDAIADSLGDHQETMDALSMVVSAATFESQIGYANWVYELKLENRTKLLDLLQQDLQIFGSYPTWEYDARKRQFVMRFRQIGTAAVSAALNSGRNVDDSTIAAGTQGVVRNAGDPLCSGLIINCNYNGKDYLGQLLIKPSRYLSGAANSAETRTTSTKNWKCRHLDAIDKHPSKARRLMTHFVDHILAHLCKPRPEIEFEVTLEALIKFGVGLDVLINDDYVRNPYDGSLGLTNFAGVVYSCSVDLQRGKAKIRVRLSDQIEYGIAPAMKISSGNSVITAAGNPGTVTICPDLREFHRSTDRVDVSCFDCLSWNSQTNKYKSRDCSCGDYPVISLKHNDRAASYYNWTIGSVNVTAGTAVLTGNTADWTVAQDTVILFAPWNTSGITDCQKLWCALADENNELLDSLSVATRGRRWV